MIIKGISHVHSCYSYDGTLDLDELIDIFKKKDCNFILLTEHAEKGMRDIKYERLKQECKKLSQSGFILIPGLEYISKEGYHILAIGVDYYENLTGKESIEILKKIKEAGGLSIIAHPKRYNYQISKRNVDFADGIEVWNTNYDGIKSIKRNIELFKSSLRYNPNLICFGGMDFHLFENKENTLYIYMHDIERLSKDKIISSLKNGKFEISNGVFTISSGGKIKIQNYKRFFLELLNMYKILLKIIIISVLKKTKINRIFNFLLSIQKSTIYPKIEEIESGKVLIISPHPDDDLIGCGGTICKYIKNNSKVKVVYMTDGRMGNPDIPLNELINIRKEEAKNALHLLGCQDIIFLNYPDHNLNCDTDSIGRILNILKEYRPQSIYVPFFLDNHPDHIATVKIVASALRYYPHNLNCYNYEVWTALPPNIIVDISDVIDKKIKAIKTHKTQINKIDYAEKIRGLNAYRSITAGRDIKYCEAFYKCSKQEYINLAKKMDLIQRLK